MSRSSATARGLLAVALLAIAGCAAGAGSSAPAPSGAGSTLQRPGATASEAEPNPSTASDPPDSASLDGCSLLTDEEILAATGHPVEFLTHEYSEFDAGCIWNLEPASEFLALDLGILLTGGREFYDAVGAGLEGMEPVTGIGDEAVASSQGELLAVTGDTAVYLQYTAEPMSADATRTLLEAVISRLP